jgi:hypothetical protein
MDVRLGDFGLAARADGADAIPFGDVAALSHAERPQMHERDGVTVCGPNGDRAASGRHSARKGDFSARRSDDGRAKRGADVDSAVLPSGVGVVAEVEWS